MSLREELLQKRFRFMEKTIAWFQKDNADLIHELKTVTKDRDEMKQENAALRDRIAQLEAAEVQKVHFSLMRTENAVRYEVIQGSDHYVAGAVKKAAEEGAVEVLFFKYDSGDLLEFISKEHSLRNVLWVCGNTIVRSRKYTEKQLIIDIKDVYAANFT